MATVCTKDTCSIEHLEDPIDGGLVSNVRLQNDAAVGGLQCVDGLSINRYLAAPAVAPPPIGTFNRIGLTDDGEVFAEKAATTTVNLGDGSVIAIPDDGGTSINSLSVGYTNATAAPQLVEVFSERTTAVLETTGGPTEYEYFGIMVMELSLVDVTGGTQDRQRIDMLANFATNGRDIIRAKKLHQTVRVPAGMLLTIRTFIETTVRTNLINNGFQSRENYLIIHHTT